MLRHVASWGDRCPHIVHVAQCAKPCQAEPSRAARSEGGLGGPIGAGWPIRKAKALLYILARGLRPSTREERVQTHEHDLFQALRTSVFASRASEAMAGVADAPGRQVERLRLARLAHLRRAGRDLHRTLDGGADPAHPDDTRPDPAAASGRSGRAGPAAAQVRLRHRSMAGLLGAGLLGALFGGGFLGGLGGLASMFGLLLQVALIGGLIYLVVRFFRRRSGSQPSPALSALARAAASERSALGGVGPTGPVAGGSAASERMARASAEPVRRERADEVGIGPQEYAAFEKTLHDVQTAYGREDVAALWNLATPEMAGYFQEELNDNARNNAINKISDVSLLQGDLAEAWREGATDYASVAMRYSLKDVTLDRTTGRVVDGDRATSRRRSPRSGPSAATTAAHEGLGDPAGSRKPSRTRDRKRRPPGRLFHGCGTMTWRREPPSSAPVDLSIPTQEREHEPPSGAAAAG